MAEHGLWVQRALAAKNLPVAARFFQDYESSTTVAEEQAYLDTCLVQAISLRAAQKMQLLDTLWWAAEQVSKSGKAPAKRRAKNNAGSRSSAPKGFGAVAKETKKKERKHFDCPLSMHLKCQQVRDSCKTYQIVSTLLC